MVFIGFDWRFRIPEIGEDLPDKNPFINADGLPDFKNITADICLSRIGRQASEVEQVVSKVEAYLDTLKTSETKPVLSEFLDNVIHPLEEVDAQLHATWSLANTLYHSNTELMPVKGYISMHQRAHRADSAKFNSRKIYKAMKEMRTIYAERGELTKEQERLFDRFLLEGKLNGGELDAKDYENLMYQVKKLNSETLTFESKLLVALDQFKHKIVDYSAVRSFPPKLLQAMSLDTKNHLNGPWVVTLKPHIYNGYLEHCPVSSDRWNVWQANTRKASTFGSVRELDNSSHIELIRDQRDRQAKILGFTNYAQMSMETKWVGSVERAQEFIAGLLKYARPAQETELKKLTEFATKNGFNGMLLEEHDIPYWKRKYNISVCQYDENLILDYFPLPSVLAGMFALAEKLFAIRIIERSTEGVSRWHANVKLYDVFDAKHLSTPFASFYLDACAPDSDRSHPHNGVSNGWSVTIRDKCAKTNSTPLVSLIYNFTAPIYGKPCTLTLNEVQILFEKFGYSLQNLLTETKYRELAGHRGVEWDAVGISSNVFTNLLYRSDVLKSISEHVSTKEPLSDELIGTIQRQRLTFAGYNLSMQLYMSALDLELHSRPDFWCDIVRKLWPQYHVIPMDKRDKRLCSTPEIVSGAWVAGYFSHLWAQMVAADVISAFDECSTSENSQTNEDHLRDVGKRYRHTFLASGGAVHPSQVFRNFRGRDPCAKALVNYLQLQPTTGSIA